MQQFALDSATGKTLTIGLFRNVENTGEIKAKLLDGSLKCSVITPKLILDPFQVVVAANKAAINALNGKLVTKTIYTELLLSLSASRSISQALITFGISDTHKDLIVCTIEDDASVGLDQVVPHIKGELCEMDVLSTLCDTPAIIKLYKLHPGEAKRLPMVESVVSRIAIGEFA